MARLVRHALRRTARIDDSNLDDAFFAALDDHEHLQQWEQPPARAGYWQGWAIANVREALAPHLSAPRRSCRQNATGAATETAGPGINSRAVARPGGATWGAARPTETGRDHEGRRSGTKPSDKRDCLGLVPSWLGPELRICGRRFDSSRGHADRSGHAGLAYVSQSAAAGDAPLAGCSHIGPPRFRPIGTRPRRPSSREKLRPAGLRGARARDRLLNAAAGGRVAVRARAQSPAADGARRNVDPEDRDAACHGINDGDEAAARAERLRARCPSRDAEAANLRRHEVRPRGEAARETDPGR